MRLSPLVLSLAAASSSLLLSLPSLQAQVASSALVNGQVFINLGLVGVGRLPASTRDTFGETVGSFSALTYDSKAWKRRADGSYEGTFFMQPDRGYNNPNTTNWRARFFTLGLLFTPSASGGAAQDQVRISVNDTTLLTEQDGTPFTALDASAVGTRSGFPALPQAHNGRLSLDAEGIVRLPDGSLFISDEYGPYIYKFSAAGKLLSALRPPEAIIPKRNGGDSFASNSPALGQPAPVPANPSSGRQNNQGLEGLTLSPDGKTLFALLQSATRQDGGTGGSSTVRFNTRLLAFDISAATPVLKGEYVLQLPTFKTSTGATLVAAQSEILAINSTQFLVIARDSGYGHTLASAASLYRSILIYDISAATNIAGSKFDEAASPLAPGGVLDASIRPAARSEFINLNDATQLAKFGLHNGPTDDQNNLSEKWEALTLVPALDPLAPNDYFLFVGNDNDFITSSGYQDGAAYADPAGMENDSMLLVFRLTLPSRLLNVSSRAMTGAGANTHIAGFIVSGPKPKQFLIRGVGPSLAKFEVPNPLSDPSLQLFNAAGQQLLNNDNWGQSANVGEIREATLALGAFTLPEGSKDSALLVSLDPGSYTAQVSGSSGISLLEVYELP